MPQDLNVALRIRADLKNAIAQLDRLETELKQTGRAGGQARAGMRQAASETERLNRAARRSASGVNILKGAVAGIGFGLLVREATQAVRAVTDTGLAFEALQQRFTFAANGFRAGAEEMAFVRAEAERLGLPLLASAQGLSSLQAALRGTGISLGQSRNVFLGVAEAAAVLRLNSEQVRGALTAIEQVASKGTVQAEELRGQLGERIPGAFQIAARAMGVTTEELNKMLEQGEVLASDFLPRFGAQLRREFGDSVPDAADSAQASFNRLGNAIEDLKDSVARSGVLDFLAEVARRLTHIVRISSEAGVNIESLGGDAAVPGGGLNADQAAALRNVDFNALRRGEPGAEISLLEVQLVEATDRLSDAVTRREEIARKLEPIVQRLESGSLFGGAVAVEQAMAAQLQAELDAANEELDNADKAVVDMENRIVEIRRRVVAESAAATEDAQRAASQPPPAPPPDLTAIDKALKESAEREDRFTDERLRASKALGTVIIRDYRRRVEEINDARAKALAAARGNAEQVARIEAQFGDELLEAERRRDARLNALQQNRAEARQRAADRAEREAEREARAAERASERQGRAARSVFEAVQDVNTELAQGGNVAYRQREIAIERWRAANLRALQEVGLANGALAEAVEDASTRMQAALQEQRTVLGGVRAAIRDYAEEAADAGAQAGSAMRRTLGGMEDALTRFTSTGKLEISDFVNSAIADFARLAIRSQITGPLFGALGGALGLPVGVAHSGGVAGSLARQRTVDPRVFAFAPRYHEGGIAGLRPDEVPAILQRGETVLPRGAGMPAFAPRIAIEFVNQGTPQREVSRDVRFDPEAMVVQIVVDNVENGGPIRNAVRRAATPGAI